MLQEKWLALSKSEQDLLVMKFGLSRTGENEVSEEELQKIVHLLAPVEHFFEEKEEPVEEVKVKKGKKSKK